ncbi:hypothetical protein CERSUDRAFT_51627 [Gelatoporia subvermispora B]|uniref:RNase III domain-containing protein n=1 Tax=Ceriporiopsis subvermispora (strain B) TaxID=914234 RepID=M2RF29_CERS8|nr:hypothetical protein CERSUDRAFT_51627 [Gelatoporia subvermispora B]
MTTHDKGASHRPLTGLQEYMNQIRLRPITRNAPRIEAPLRDIMKNSRRLTSDNNDVLEFIGDRAVNLVSALLVEKVKLSNANHQAVSKKICTNDTFGRLAFCLNFHKDAKFDECDAREVQDWNPFCGNAPPKVLADLFEAYAGAVYIQHGLPRLRRWLEDLLEPLILVATADHWLSASPESFFGAPMQYKPPYDPVVETRRQSMLLDYMEFKMNHLTRHGKPLKNALPQEVKFNFDSKGCLKDPSGERLEVATHFINMTICKITINTWPGYVRARSKGPHLFTVSCPAARR